MDEITLLCYFKICIDKNIFYVYWKKFDQMLFRFMF
jgi:hypothetical protein